MARNGSFASRLIEEGIDLNKDYFQLDRGKLDTVERVRKEFGYSGANQMGRSKSRQFYYAAQKGAETLGMTQSEINAMKAQKRVAYRAQRKAQGLSAG